MTAFSDARNSTESAFTQLVASIDWLFSKMEKIDSLQTIIMKFYSISSSWFQVIVWSLLIFLLTAIPGVCVVGNEFG